jgi:hypothetical protein
LTYIPTHCPACGGGTSIERVRCVDCSTAVEGRFEFGWQARLTAEQLAFARVFLECRGKIKDVEQVLGLSYPTVVARLDDVVGALASAPPAPPPREDRRGVLDALSDGSIDVNEAVRRLKKEKP